MKLNQIIEDEGLVKLGRNKISLVKQLLLHNKFQDINFADY